MRVGTDGRNERSLRTSSSTGGHPVEHFCVGGRKRAYFSERPRHVLGVVGDSAVGPAARPVRCGGEAQPAPILSHAEAATARTSLRTTVTPGIGLLPTPSAWAAAWAFSSVS